MPVTINLNEIDVQKIKFLKNRLGYKKNIDLVRYLVTVEVERILQDPGIKRQIFHAMEREYREELEKTQREKVAVPNVVNAYS